MKILRSTFSPVVSKIDVDDHNGYHHKCLTVIALLLQDFEANHKLKNMTIDFLEDIICTPTLLPSEHRASSQLLRMLTKDEPTQNKINLDQLLTPIQASTKVILY